MMEETLPNASATRKRRSSILKNQRPPRTPFSDLEFNVATPTDANKSRRVSFSKKTGVAEFATNEATTTWKNFYEEQNKYLDLSGLDPVNHGPRASVGHLGNRVFEQHFQEVAADIGMGTIEIPTHGGNTSFNVTQQEMMLGIGRISIPHHGSNTSFNVTQQETLDCLGDDKNLTAPGQNFDFSSFTKTQHSGKVFNLTNPIMNEITDRIDIDFSAVQNIGENDIEDMDDLEGIKKDSVFSQSCSVAGPSFGNESDMSITDIIRSPKKEMLTNLFPEVKKPSMNKDWIEDKENIAVNPYVTPAESDNFAVNEESEKVLVFDGKKIKYVNKNADLDEIVKPSDRKPKKSILNLPDKSMKLQNISNMSLDKSVPQVIKKHQTILFDNDDIDAEISMTQAICNPVVKNNKTLMFNNQDDLADMSVTQAVPDNLLRTSKNTSIKAKFEESLFADISLNKTNPVSVFKDNKQQTIVFTDDIAEISVTQCVPDPIVKNMCLRERTILYDKDENIGDMSLTQVLPNKILSAITNEDISITEDSTVNNLAEEGSNEVEIGQKQHTITVYQDESFTQVIPSYLIAESIRSRRNTITSEKETSLATPDKSKTKRQTIVFTNNDENGDMSITQAIRSEVVEEINNKTIIFEDNAGGVSLTQVIPTQIVDNNEVLNDKDNGKRRTIVFEDSMCDITMTQTIPVHILTDNKRLSEVQMLEKNKRKTIVFDTDVGELSMTQAIPAQIIPQNEIHSDETIKKRKTIVFEGSMGNISMTQAIPVQIMSEQLPNKENVIFDHSDEIKNKCKTIVSEDSMGDVLMTEAVPAQIIFDTDVGEISISQEIAAQIIPQNEIHSDETVKKRNTIVFENSMGNVSMAQGIPVKIMSDQLPNNENVICDHSDEIKNKRKTIVFEDSMGDILMTQAVPAQIISQNIYPDENERKLETIVFENSMGDISTTRAIPAQILAKQNTTMFDGTKADLSITQTQPGEILDASEAELISSETQTKIDTSAVEVKSVQTSTYMPIVINQNVIVYHASPTKNKITDKVNSNFSTESEISQISEEILSKTSREMSAKTSEESNKSSEGSYKSLEDAKDDHLNVYLRRFISGKSDGFVRDNNGSQRLNPAIMSNVLGLSGINLTGSEESSSMVNKNPSSKGDDFHASSDNITEPAATLNNPPVAHGHQAPRLLSKKNEGLFEPRKSEEQKIQSISYDALATSSTKMEIFEDSFSDNKGKNELELSASRKSVAFIDDTSKGENVTKKSLLNDLLNMSDDTDEKNIISTSKRISFGEKLAKMFYHKSPRSEKKIVVKEENEKNTTDITKNSEVRKYELKLDSEPEENEEDENSDGGLQKKLVELQISRRMSMNNTHFDREKCFEPDNKDINVDTFNFSENNTTRGNDDGNNADDTDHILDMLSKLTDKTFRGDAEVTKQKQITVNNEKLDVQSTLATNVDKMGNDKVAVRNEVGNKIKELSKRYSLTPSLDKSDCSYSGENSAKSTGMKRSIRISNEVIKTLHFDEDVEESAPQTINELVEKGSNNTYNEVVPNDMANESKIVTPLKKSFVGFDESTSNKSKVIPTYEIDESLKALMSDLVKPMADVLPISSRFNHSVRDKPSTCSTQIQANLISSSQIDMETELVSNADSMYDLDQLKYRSSMFDNNHTSKLSEAYSNTVTQDVSLKPDEKGIENEYKNNSILPEQVVVFDHSNPLNNVLLAPIDFSDAHEYNPKSESIQSSNVSIVKRMEFVNTLNNKLDNLADEMQSGDSLEIKDCVSTFSFPSKASTISTVSRASEVLDAEVNTVLAMKDNKELLEVNSSLTLVDDFKSSVNCAVPLNDESEPEYMDLDEPESTKAKKRNFSPSNPGKYITTSVEVTPKPSIKLQKLSLSPKSQKKSPSQVRFNLEVETLSKPKSPNSKMDIESPKSSTKPNKSPSPYRRSLSPKKIISTKKHSPDRKSPSKNRRPSSNVTVQQLITHYGEDVVNRSIQQLVREISPSNIADTGGFSSTISLNSKEDDIEPPAKLTGRDNNSEVELVNDITSRSSLDSAAELELVDNISKLPFMGTKDCVWESRTDREWSFLLLHSRLRVILHVSGGHVTKLSVDVARHDKKNSIAALTVHVALEVLRYMTSSVPTNPCALLSRCARVSHVADKWAEAMRDAKLRLAITVKDDWVVSFKALNIPLREIWEIQLRIEPSLSEGSSWPWPRAEIIRVVSVTGDGPCQLENARKALNSVKKCWGHVPEGIWAIFEQLKKYKPREDPLLALLS